MICGRSRRILRQFEEFAHAAVRTSQVDGSPPQPGTPDEPPSGIGLNPFTPLIRCQPSRSSRQAMSRPRAGHGGGLR
jgi:hypothetical protein